MSNRNFTYLILTTVTLFSLAFISYLIQPRYETFIKKGELIFNYSFLIITMTRNRSVGFIINIIIRGSI